MEKYWQELRRENGQCPPLVLHSLKDCCVR